MPHLRNLTFLALAPAALASLTLAGLFAASGCEAYHNEAERLAYKKALDAQEAKLYPKIDGTAGSSAGVSPGYNPPDSTQCPSNGDCLEDPGSRVVSSKECKETEWGLEFFPLPIFDFEDDRDGFDDKNKDRVRDPGEEAISGERYALLGYTYKDDTTLNFYPFGWEPMAIPDPFGRCAREDNHVFHIAGGPFLEWGGGFGRSLRCMNAKEWANNPTQVTLNDWRRANGIPQSQIDKGQIYCHYGTSKGATRLLPTTCGADPKKYPQMLAACPKRDVDYKEFVKSTDPNKKFPAEELPLVGVTIDVSEWEGVSFWARRGPNSQPGIRVLLGDRYTDDDLSFAQYLLDPMAPRSCERAFECKCKSSSRPCTKMTDEEISAINLALNSIHDDIIGQCEPLATPKERTVCYNQPNSYNLTPPVAGDTMCWDRNGNDAITVAAQTMQYCGESVPRHQTDSAKSLNAQLDPFIFDTTCQEFSFRGSITSSFAYNPDSEIPGQRKPTEASQTCGDHWMRSVTLSLDWQFYMIPFTEFLQQNWAKRSYKLDLTSLSLVRLTWDRGYIDYYIDDVRFYRKKPLTEETK